MFCTLKGTVEELCKKIAQLSSDISDKNKDAWLNRIEVVIPKSKETIHILELTRRIGKEDTFVLFGCERLFNKYVGEGRVIREYDDLKLRIYSEEDIPWNEVTDKLKIISDDITMDSKFIAIISVDKRLHEQISNQLQQKKDPEISYLIIETNQYLRDIQYDVLIATDKVELESLLNTIEENKDKISNNLYLFLKSEIYIKLGLRNESLQILKQIYGFINDSDKLIMAELLISQNELAEALVILQEIYSRDPFVPGLIRALIRVSKKMNENDELEKWLSLGEQENSDLEYVLHEAANYYNKTNNFIRSSEYYRKLCDLTGNIYFELMARVCDIQGAPPQSGQDAESYILAISLEHPEVEQEAYYRVGLIWWHLYNSPFKAYDFLQKLNCKYENIIKATQYKFMVLKDPIFSSLALGKIKPFEKIKDAQTLAKTIVTELLKGLEPLSSIENGYVIWQDFIEKAQNEMIWKRYLSTELINRLKSWMSTDIAHFNKSTYILNVLKENENKENLEVEVKTVIEMLYRIKTGKLGLFPKDDINQLINGSLIVSEKEGTTLDRLWIRYESSYIYSLCGENQNAINFAISIFYIGNTNADPIIRKYSKALGFSAWANSQFRLGRVVEGLSCAIVAIDLAIELENLSIMQDCLQLVFKWGIEFNNFFKAEEKEVISDLLMKVSNYLGVDNKFVEIESAIVKDDWTSVYKLLKPLVIGDNIKHDLEWAGHFSNFISSCLKTDKEDEGYNLIMKMSSEAVEILSARLDLRAKAILMFVQVIMAQSTKIEVDLIKAKELITIAIDDIESSRRSLFHATERASLTEMYQKIYRTSLEINLLIFLSSLTPKEKKESALIELIGTFAFVTPRTIIEKRSYSSKVTSELLELEKKYKNLLDELTRIEKSVDVEAYKKTTKELEKIRQELTQKHPYYSQLHIYQKFDSEEIQKFLEDDDLFYQYVLTQVGVAFLLVTKKTLQIGLIPSDVNDLRSMSKILGEKLTNYDGRGNRDEQIEQLCESITRMIYEPIFSYLHEKSIKKLYICPDMSMPFFSSALMRSNQTWLICSVSSICNVVDPRELMHKNLSKSDMFNKKCLVTLGAPFKAKNDAIHIAKTWFDKNKFEMIEVLEDYSQLESKAEEQKPKILIIIAHGIPHPSAGDLSGAHVLQGHNKKTIWAEDLKDICDNCETLITISCGSGIPFIGQVETSEGIWANVVSTNGNAVLCKWDVDIRPCLEILNSLLNEMQKDNNSIPEILCEAQRKLLNSDQWCHPSFWAGLEYWGI
ncbi:CHAT domain-containing protein [Brevibacillus sp. SYSU BS000544]|uniref:tetratricopeptide repeat protein n=1 Tax=Brevibacillus sp. SYSU BS000544 TaxID=3416443 RepID=UPI003CE46CDB